jgi:hypothetical protein
LALILNFTVRKIKRKKTVIGPSAFEMILEITKGKGIEVESAKKYGLYENLLKRCTSNKYGQHNVMLRLYSPLVL